MPLFVKISTIWLFLIVLGAIYAKLDNFFNDSLPLQDPLLQTNGFNPKTGTRGTGAPIEGVSSAHWLGTDVLARDTFSRIVHGSWVSIIVAFVSAVVGIGVGGFLGALVGFVRGRTETIVMSLIDVILAFPALVLLLAMVSIFEVRNLYVIAGVIGFLSIPAYTRVARANSLGHLEPRVRARGQGHRHQTPDDPVQGDHPQRLPDAAVLCARRGRVRHRGRGVAVVPRVCRCRHPRRPGAT